MTPPTALGPITHSAVDPSLDSGASHDAYPAEAVPATPLHSAVMQPPLQISGSGNGTMTINSDQPLTVTEVRTASFAKGILLSSKKPLEHTPGTVDRKLSSLNLTHVTDDNPFNAFVNALKLAPKDTDTIDVMLMGHGQIIGGKHFYHSRPMDMLMLYISLKLKMYLE